jgi:hypothetical protein
MLKSFKLCFVLLVSVFVFSFGLSAYANPEKKEQTQKEQTHKMHTMTKKAEHAKSTKKAEKVEEKK